MAIDWLIWNCNFFWRRIHFSASEKKCRLFLLLVNNVLWNAYCHKRAIEHRFIFIGALGRKRLCTNDIENSKKKMVYSFVLLFGYSYNSGWLYLSIVHRKCTHTQTKCVCMHLNAECGLIYDSVSVYISGFAMGFIQKVT